MAPTAHHNLCRRLRLAVAGAAVATTLMAATAAASPPAPMAAPATGPAQQGADPDRRAGAPPPGFLLDRGRFKPVTVPPGLEDLTLRGIAPIDLNDRGQIVGTYEEPSGGAVRGFLLQRDRFTRINPPGAKGTQPQGINNRGQIVGKYSDVSGAVSSGVPVRGFLLDRGRYLRLDVPGAVSSQAFDINDRGQVVGEYQDAAGVLHGYLWQRGRFRTIDAGTATGINNRGQITGITGDPTAPVEFLLDRGRVTTFTVPGAQLTVPYGINDQGQIVGLSASGPTATTGSGFLRDARGRITAINRPGAAITVAFDINNRGQIVGVAVNPEDLASPPPTDPAPMGRMA
jgi:probable HAF family extracellular repeat protein